MRNVQQLQFNWIVVDEYFDGPMSGLALSEGLDRVMFFQIVGWDAEHGDRVFAATAVDPSLARGLVDDLVALETPRRPIWVLGPASVTPATTTAWEQLRHAAKHNPNWALLQSHDLTSITDRTELSPTESQSLIAMIDNDTIAELGSEELVPEFLAKLNASRQP